MAADELELRNTRNLRMRFMVDSGDLSSSDFVSLFGYIDEISKEVVERERQNLLAHHGRISEAVLALERAVKVDPKNEMAAKNLDTLLRHEPPGDMATGLTPLETRELHVAEA